MVQLNVVLHGLWGIETNPDGIRIVTVDDHHHVIKAGTWARPEHDLKNLPGKTYRLEGATPGAPCGKHFNPDQNPTVKGDPNQPLQAKLELVRTLIELPCPKEIRSERRLKTNGVFFDNDFPETPSELAMVQVLIYDVPDPGLLKLSPLDAPGLAPLAAPGVNPDGRDTINLHLFAEPDEITVQDVLKADAKALAAQKRPAHHSRERQSVAPSALRHFQTAYRNLANAFGLTITPLATADVAPTDPGIPGLSLVDMISLQERGNSLAGSPDNCCMLTINNCPG